MAGQKRETFEPVTLGHIRSHGCRDLLVYCGSMNCNHGVTVNADHMPDDTAIRPLGSGRGARSKRRGREKVPISRPPDPWRFQHPRKRCHTSLGDVRS
jgi:hypothetical protein